MRLTFHGAASEVTGSKHLVEIAGDRILLDCGMVQTERRESRERNAGFDFDPASIQAVVVSHAHFDHVGHLPFLVKRGFRGRIYASAATRDLTELILLDAAKLQTQEAEYLNRHQSPEAELALPLYSQEDIPAVMARFLTLPYGTGQRPWTKISDHVQAKLYDAGHILGSAVIVLEGREGGQTRRLAYTGDLGRWNRPLLRDPQKVDEAVEVAIAESTYGSRIHHPADEVESAVIEVVAQAVRTKGKIIVPAFSLGRTQQLIYILHWLTDQGRLPRIPVVVDSPLATRITEVFARHQRDYDLESRKDFSEHGEDPLEFRNLRFTQTVEESKALNSEPGPLLIISASGMATGGRVMHHLKNLLPDPAATVLFTGYQAHGTLGRRLLNGEYPVRIYGQAVPVKASIRSINDLSAHADANEIDEYLSAIDTLQRVFLVHGERDRSEALQKLLQSRHPDWRVAVPFRNETADC